MPGGTDMKSTLVLMLHTLIAMTAVGWSAIGATIYPSFFVNTLSVVIVLLGGSLITIITRARTGNRIEEQRWDLYEQEKVRVDDALARMAAMKKSFCAQEERWIQWQRDAQRAIRAEQAKAHRLNTGLDRMVDAMPTLYAMYIALHPDVFMKYGTTSATMYDFSEWLRDVTTSGKTNLMAWIFEVQEGSKHPVDLVGLFDHIRPESWPSVIKTVEAIGRSELQRSSLLKLRAREEVRLRMRLREQNTKTTTQTPESWDEDRVRRNTEQILGSSRFHPRAHMTA